MKHAAVWALGACIVLLLTGCGEKKQPAAAPAPAPEVAPQAEPARAAVNWAAVEAVTDGGQIITVKGIARHCDGWFKGARETITLRHDGRGAATDGEGHSVPVTLEMWKGIQRDTRLAGDTYLAVAAKSQFYTGSDTFGTIPRYKYKLEIVDESTIRFRNTGKMDDGT